MDAFYALSPTGQLKFSVIVLIAATALWIWLAKRIGNERIRAAALWLPTGIVIGAIAMATFFPPEASP